MKRFENAVSLVSSWLLYVSGAAVCAVVSATALSASLIILSLCVWAVGGLYR